MRKDKSPDIRGAYDKFPDIFVISSGCNALVVPFQQLLEGPMEVLLSKCVSDLCHSLFDLNCLITTASKFFHELRE